MYSKLIIDGNEVYETDEECLKKRKEKEEREKKRRSPQEIAKKKR